MSQDRERNHEPRERKGPPNIDGMFTLKIDNISNRSTMDSLRELFGKYGEVGDVYIPRMKNSTEPRGFAFVRFHEKDHALDAMKEVDNTEVDGKLLRVQEALKKRVDNPREFYQDRNQRNRDDRGDRGRRFDSRDRNRNRSSSRSRRDNRDDRVQRYNDRGDDRRDDRVQRYNDRGDDRRDDRRDDRNNDRRNNNDNNRDRRRERSPSPKRRTHSRSRSPSRSRSQRR